MQSTMRHTGVTGAAATRRGGAAPNVLRFVVAGSVDDGKSSLIGRLLHDTGAVFDDQLAQLGADRGTQVDAMQRLALLTDGLRAEREQGITIDIAHRYFSTPRRKFVVIDAPGHAQYTRNMVTGASNADVAVVLVDVRHGLVEQSRRHSYLAALLGVRELVFAVNKLDLVDFAREPFERCAQQLHAWVSALHGPRVRAIPVCALTGDNVATRSEAMPWYDGPTLLEYLEHVDVAATESSVGFRLPVQWVLQAQADDVERGYAGVVSGGRLAAGDAVIALPSGQRSRVRDVRTHDGALTEAHPGQSVAVYLEDHLDVSRGEMLCHADAAPATARAFEATLAWMGNTPLEVGRTYALRHTTRWLRARVTSISSEVDVHSLEAREGAGSLDTNAIGHVRLETSHPLAHDAYEHNRETGAFILVDEASHETVAAGMLNRALEVDALGSDEDGAPALGVCLVVPAQAQAALQVRRAREALERSGLHVCGLLLCRDDAADSARDVSALAELRADPAMPPVVGVVRDGVLDDFDGSHLTRSPRPPR